jgi:hypothetical protein
MRPLCRPLSILLLIGIPFAPARAQVLLERGMASLTTEAFANLSGGVPHASDNLSRQSDEDWRLDGALRLLGRIDLSDAFDLGARVVLATSPEDELDVAEYSLLVFGGGGRLELGARQGLPDVLTGYAPNNFTFTSAEFGPASGPSLDPAGGLQTAFLPGTLAAQIDELTTLGFAASLSADESMKVLYVTPKWRGLLAGISYADDAEDPRFGRLVQAGLTHEAYWAQNVLRFGGSYSFARGDASQGTADLHSLNLGATLVLDDSLIIGASATWNGDSGIRRSLTRIDIDDAWGWVTSVNYNYGPWTIGAFYQWATSEGNPDLAGDDRLSAAEAGVSYRINTRVRFYGAYYHYDFENEGGGIAADRDAGGVLIVGVRVTL